MFKSKLIKGILMGACISLLSTGTAFAAINEDNLSQEAMQYLAEDKGEGQSSSGNLIDESILTKQKEVDQYVFNDNADKLKEMGFEVVYTSPMEGFVEIGISPYKEEYANFLYEALGKDTVKIVEGDKAIAYTTMVADEAPDTPVSNDESESYVGEDMTLEDGEFGIVSVETDGESDVALDDSKIAESGIAVQDNGVVKTSVVENVNGNNSKNNSVMFTSITIIGIVIILSGIVLVGRKKKSFKNR